MPDQKYTKEDFMSHAEVRWCPGCGDYAILAALQRVLPELGLSPEKHVFVSGIGCAGAHKLIATQPTTASHHVPELKPAVTIKPENLLRFGHLKRIAADPVNHIAPGRHAAHAMFSIVSPSVKRFST